MRTMGRRIIHKEQGPTTVLIYIKVKGIQMELVVLQHKWNLGATVAGAETVNDLFKHVG